MVRRFHLFWVLLMGGAALGATNRAMAQSVSAAPVTAQARATSPLVERQRVRGELARVQAEIDQLKKSERGLRADYLLRARLADAEALARRLTELDDLLQASSPPRAPRGPAPIGDEPRAIPTDGPAELEAKADILADQAHRVQGQAAALRARIEQLRGRRELRRRAHQLDSDPFAPLEGSKRRLLTGGGTTAGTTTADSASPPRSAPGPASVATAAAGATLGSITPPVPTNPTPTAPVQVHDLLDPATLAPMRKTDASGAATADLDAMERALAALNARSQYLDAQARQLRARAQGH